MCAMLKLEDNLAGFQGKTVIIRLLSLELCDSVSNPSYINP